MAVCLAEVFPILWYWIVSSVSIVTCGIGPSLQSVLLPVAVCHILAVVFPILWYWTVSSVSIVTCGGLSDGSVPDPVVLDRLFSQHCDL